MFVISVADGGGGQFVRPDLVDFVFSQIDFNKLPANSRLTAGAKVNIVANYQGVLYTLGSGLVPDRAAVEDEGVIVESVVAKFKEHVCEVARRSMPAGCVEDFTSSLYGSMEVAQVCISNSQCGLFLAFGVVG